MIGGSDNDHYVIDHNQDTITDSAGSTDSVLVDYYGSIGDSFDLPSGIENAALSSTANLTINGNELNNELVGNSLNNQIGGSSGSDTLYGLARKYGTSVNAIKRVNGMTSDVIFKGKTIKIP